MANQTDPDTGPLLVLREQGLPLREIAKRVNMSPTTVWRRLQAVEEAREALRQRNTWITVMCVVLTLCAVLIAVAMAKLAWF
jgi:AcrR family transcriptional regulator